MTADTEEAKFDFEAAKKLPANILFGTSSWTYPGWKGLVYREPYKDEKDLKARCLLEYGKFGWFKTVGIDSSFYSPLSAKLIARYSEDLPAGMKWTQKVWEEITIPVYGKHPRYGAKAGKANQQFLDPAVFKDKVLGPYEEGGGSNRLGVFIFEFQRFGVEWAREPEKFIGRLRSFLKALPSKYRYATEIRTPEILTREYFDVLNEFGATHCFNHWSYMPTIKSQMKVAAAAGGLAAPFYVARLLTPLGVKYEEAVDRFSPYNKICEPQIEMREDIVRLAKRAVEKKADTYIIVNNRVEGCAPYTIDAIGRKIVGELG